MLLTIEVLKFSFIPKLYWITDIGQNVAKLIKKLFVCKLGNLIPTRSPLVSSIIGLPSTWVRAASRSAMNNVSLILFATTPWYYKLRNNSWEFSPKGEHILIMEIGLCTFLETLVGVRICFSNSRGYFNSNNSKVAIRSTSTSKLLLKLYIRWSSSSLSLSIKFLKLSSRD